MRHCPTCGARYEAPAQYCQRDGAPLRIEQEARDPYLGTKILGQFRVEKVIGSGGMGIVYAAWDEGLGRRLAVKILHKDLVTNRDVVARFHREAQIAHQLDHPNIVRLIHFGQLPDNNLFLLLEYLEGPTLLGALERERVIAPARVVKIMAAAADAIGYAHRRDIVHRDLKPENIILVNREGDADFPKILDFGIAKMLMGGDTLVTQAGLIFGTARYISPEGAQGDPVDKRSDVYSLGVIAYQMLTGRSPFDAQEPVQLLLKHIHEAPPAMRAVAPDRPIPPALEAVVMRALAKNPAARYGDGASFARALREAMAESDPSSAIRSVVPTAAMPMYVGAAAIAAPAAPAPVSSYHPPPPASFASADSGVRQNPTVHPVPPVAQHTVLAAQPAPALHAPSLHAPPQPAQYPSASRSGPHPSILRSNVPPTAAMSAYVPSVDPNRSFAAPVELEASRFGSPAHDSGPYAPSPVPSRNAAIYPSDPDEGFDVPGLGSTRKSKPGDSRTARTVILSVVLTMLVGAGAAWALGLYPAQRAASQREQEVGDLLRRAEDAFNAEHYVHDPNANDVEHLTDSVIGLAPNNTRARQLRAAAASRLRNAAVQALNESHADRAIPLLNDAMLLADDDSELQRLLAQAEQQSQSPTAPTPPVAPSRERTQPARTTPRTTHASTAPEPTTPPPSAPVPVVSNPHPTFTPGRDPSQNPPPAQHTAPPPQTVQQPPPPQVVQPPPPQVVQPPPSSGGMTGGPSPSDNPPPPPSDPNGGGVAF